MDSAKNYIAYVGTYTSGESKRIYTFMFGKDDNLIEI